LPESIAEALDAGTAMLRERTDSPRADALLLIARALQRDRTYVVAHSDDVFSSDAAERFYEDCRRRATGIPIAYVLGSAGFYGREFAVDERVLVPRPESESLIEAALAFAVARNGELSVLDLGTGSGALGCTLAAELSNANVDAVDCSKTALDVARLNARRLSVQDRCRFFLGNLAEPLRGLQYDIVLANLPYVESYAIPAAPAALSFEPRLALDGGRDGLQVYGALLRALRSLLLPKGLALLEAGSHQIERLANLARTAYPEAVVGTGRDLGGSERFVSVLAPGR
jgi:release factor glutamine methyltransferase